MIRDGFYYEKAKFFANENKLDFSGKTCILLISVGQRYHEINKLSATIELINQYGFKSCEIVVADTLQRHNMLDELKSDKNMLAAKQGQEWIDRNQNILTNLTVPYTVRRWDEFLGNPKYPQLKCRIRYEYHHNEEYRQAVDSTIELFLERIKSRDNNLRHERCLFSNCLEYLLEECPIIMPLWAELGYDYIIYPKKMTNAMSKTREIFVENFFPEKAIWLALKFIKKFKKCPLPEQ